LLDYPSKFAKETDTIPQHLLQDELSPLLLSFLSLLVLVLLVNF
jgi:hypothetical protein